MKHLVVLLAAPLLAQDLYLMTENFTVSPGERVKVGICSGDSFPVSESAPAPDQIRDPSMYTSGGAYNMTSLRVEDDAAFVDAVIKGSGTPLLAVKTAPSVRQVEAPKFHDYLLEQGFEDVAELREKNRETATPVKLRTTRYAKAILFAGKTDDAFKRRVGHAVEFVPDHNPYAARQGMTLPVHVLVKGKPGANLRVNLAYSSPGGGEQTVVGRTDASGHILIPLPVAGRYRLNVVSLERSADPQAADWESQAATLTFEIR